MINNNHDIKDLSLADQGRERVEWALTEMPVLREIYDRFAKERPLAGARISGCLHITTETANLARTLPKDGRDLALDNCQGCHIITVVVTQDRTKTAWLGTMSTPAHAVIKMTPAERDELASYLVLNAGIPIEQVPEELRASGATY